MNINQILITTMSESIKDLRRICDIIEYKDNQSTKVEISKVIDYLVDTVTDYKICSTEIQKIRET